MTKNDISKHFDIEGHLKLFLYKPVYENVPFDCQHSLQHVALVVSVIMEFVKKRADACWLHFCCSSINILVTFLWWNIYRKGDFYNSWHINFLYKKNEIHVFGKCINLFGQKYVLPPLSNLVWNKSAPIRQHWRYVCLGTTGARKGCERPNSAAGVLPRRETGTRCVCVGSRWPSTPWRHGLWHTARSLCEAQAYACNVSINRQTLL